MERTKQPYRRSYRDSMGSLEFHPTLQELSIVVFPCGVIFP